MSEKNWETKMIIDDPESIEEYLARGWDLSRELLDALGLPENLLSFTMKASVNDFLTIECEYIPKLDEEAIIEEFKRYFIIEDKGVERIKEESDQLPHEYD